MGTHDWMFRIRVLRLHRQALLLWHGGGKGGIEAVVGDQAVDFLLHIYGQIVIRQHHVGPHGVATGRWTFDATQYSTHRRRFPPGGIAVPGILVAIRRILRGLVDLHQTGGLRMAGEHRVGFKLAETHGKCFVVLA
ncbi:hypothetical protein D9M69_612190 [compost metagenome]